MNQKFDATAGVRFPGAETSRGRFNWLWWLLSSSSLLGAATVLRFQPPDQIVVPLLEIPLPTTCWTRQWLGINCPGCGLTRSFVLAAHGKLHQAFQIHPIGTIIFFLLVLQIPVRLYQGWQFATKQNGPERISKFLPRDRSRGSVELWVLATATALSFAWWLYLLCLDGAQKNI